MNTTAAIPRKFTYVELFHDYHAYHHLLYPLFFHKLVLYLVPNP